MIATIVDGNKEINHRRVEIHFLILAIYTHTYKLSSAQQRGKRDGNRLTDRFRRPKKPDKPDNPKANNCLTRTYQHTHTHTHTHRS